MSQTGGAAAVALPGSRTGSRCGAEQDVPATDCYTVAMLMGAHILLYSDKAEADRAFFRDVLGFPSVDAGDGWLIFKLPPAEVAIHPADEDKRELVHAGHRMLGSSLYLMCDDLRAQIKLLKAKKVQCTEVKEEHWGIQTTIKLPSGGEIGLYQPKHSTALGLQQPKSSA